MQTIADIERLGDKALAADLYRLSVTEGEQMKREERLQARADDMYKSLPDFYTSTDGVKRYTNMEDAMNDIDQAEMIVIARALRDGKNDIAGELLAIALKRICLKNATYEED